MKEREMKDSGIPWIGEIPNDWKIAKLKHYTNLNNGNSLNDGQKILYSQENSENLPYISTKDIEKDYEKINYHNGLSIPKNEQGFIIAPKDSILLCIEGGSAGKKIGFTRMDVFFVNKLCCISSFSEKINTRFLYYFTNSYSFSEPFFQNIQGLIGGVSVSVLKNFLFTLPSLQEQKAIAEFLDRKCGGIDELVALQDKMIEELKAYKQSIITETVTKGLNPNVPLKDSDIERIGEIPQHWEVSKIKYIGEARNGLTYSPQDMCDETKGTLVLRSSNIQNDTLCFEDNVYVDKEVDEELMMKEGDILICSRNGSAKLVGKCAIIPKHVNATFGAFMMRFRSILNRKFSLYLIRTTLAQYKELFSTSTINQLTNTMIGNMQFPLPSELEQQEIANFLDKKCSEIDSLIELKQQKIEELKDYKKSIIYEYVTGKKQIS